MLTLPAPASARNPYDPTPIPLDASTAEVRVFLDLMTKPRCDLCRAQKTQTWEKVLRLAQKYDCPLVIEQIFNLLLDHTDKDPWDLFCLAAEHDDLKLAKACIPQFGKERSLRTMTRKTRDRLPLNMAKKCKVDYLLGLMQTCGSAERGAGGWEVDGEDEPIAWEAIAELFQVAK